MKFILPAVLFLASAVSAQNVVLDYSDGIPLCCTTHDLVSEAEDEVIQQVTSAFESDGGGAWDLGEAIAGECKWTPYSKLGWIAELGIEINWIAIHRPDCIPHRLRWWQPHRLPRGPDCHLVQEARSLDCKYYS